LLDWKRVSQSQTTDQLSSQKTNCGGALMVTRHQLDKLEQRVDEIAERRGWAQRPVYVVWLSFHGESDASFFARHPDAMLPDGQRREPDVVMAFEDPMLLHRAGEFRGGALN
jgi:hypothetical protein